MPSSMRKNAFFILAASAITSATVHSVSLTRTAAPAGSSLSRRALPIVPTYEDTFFWFANYNVGSGQNLSLLVDTGSSDIFVNPGKYNPGPSSKDLNKNFTVSFSTTNPDGTGFLSLSGAYFEDSVTLFNTNLEVPNQHIGSVVDAGIPHDGLIGFAGEDSSFSGKPGWFQNLCTSRAFDECRYGMALESDESGTIHLGGLEKDAFVGELVTTPVESQWVTWGDVALNGEIVQSDVRILTDMGTAVIWGPFDTVQRMLDAAGIDSVILPPSEEFSGTIIQGSYPCASPPEFGFSFPSTQNRTTAGQNASSGSVFNILPEALAASKGGETCTTILKGVTDMDIWIIGQPFYQGKYVDHDFETNLVGWGNLR